MTVSEEDFANRTLRFRRELRAHCYRMVGCAEDAEDLVQETYLRAWRSFEGFEGRASVRSWLYKIATNVCLSALETGRIRVLPSTLTAAYDGPPRPPQRCGPSEASWLEPLPEEWIDTTDPASASIARQSVRLALIASLQHLPSRQRAIFLLREVLAFSAEETAEALGASLTAVKSGLQRARVHIEKLSPEPDELLEPTHPRAQELLHAYMAAFERSDVELLLQVLRADATLEATPFRDWQAGRVRCLELLGSYVLGNPGDWRMLPTSANGQPAAVAYRRAGDGNYQASDLVVLEATASGLSRVVAFHAPPLLARIGFPEVLGP